MFKQTIISKKIFALIVSGLMLGSFLPVQAYSKENAKRHAKIVHAACWCGAMIAGGPVISWMSFKNIIVLYYKYKCFDKTNPILHSSQVVPVMDVFISVNLFFLGVQVAIIGIYLLKNLLSDQGRI